MLILYIHDLYIVNLFEIVLIILLGSPVFVDNLFLIDAESKTNFGRTNTTIIENFDAIVHLIND